MSYFSGQFIPNFNMTNEDNQLSWSEIVDRNFNMTNEDNQLSWSEIVDRNFIMTNEENHLSWSEIVDRNFNMTNEENHLSWSEIVDRNFNMTNEDNQLSWSEIVDRNFNMKNPLLECEDSRIIGSESNNYKYTAAKCTNGIIPENYNGYNDGYGFQGQLCPTYESHSEAYSPTIEDPAVYNSNSNYPQVIQQPGLYGGQNVANCAMNTFTQQCVQREIVPLENDNFFGVNNNVREKQKNYVQ